MKNIIKDTLILFAITLVAGLGLGLVYNVTANSRAMQEEKTKIEESPWTSMPSPTKTVWRNSRMC